MKYLWIVVLCVGIFVSQAIAQEKTELKSQKEKVSYSIGLSIGKDMKKESLDIDADILAKGIKDALAGGKTLLNEKEVGETMAAFQKEMMAKHEASQKAAGEKNKKEGESFLVENKKKQGVVTLPSGLQYKVITAGEGEIPKATDTVSTNYRGTLLDGTEFDSSYKRGQPVTFPVNGVIPGWTEALQLMKVGSKWELYVPANLGYGEKGAGHNIGPNATLIFEVELLSIKK